MSECVILRLTLDGVLTLWLLMTVIGFFDSLKRGLMEFVESEPFDYTALDLEIRTHLERLRNQILQKLRDSAQIVWEVGECCLRCGSCLDMASLISGLRLSSLEPSQGL